VAQALARGVSEPVRAVGLLSGGLDSALAAKILLDRGIEVVALHLESPTACRSDVRAVAAELGVRLEIKPKGEEYLRLLRHPRWGYGRNMNPCIDCRRFMFTLGADYLEEFGAKFLFTGEALGQRPMSQTRSAMQLIDRAAGLTGWILRPLSAQLLDPTEPEKRGWVDRSTLFAIAGRGRHLQLELARRWGLTHHQSPGGGCLLTDAHFSNKLRDLFEHRAEDATTVEDVALLRIGRHFRIGPDLKIVIGRDREENAALTRYQSAERFCVEPVDFNAPTALVCGNRDETSLRIAGELIGAHARGVPSGARLRWREGAGWVERELSPAEPGAPDVALATLR